MKHTPSSAMNASSPMRAAIEMRGAIDGFAVRYAARRVAAGARPDPLLKVFAQMQKAGRAGDYAAMTALDYRLHLAIVQLADVPGLVEAWEVIVRQQEHFRIETTRRCWPDLSVLSEAHQPIVDAVCAGDQGSAEDAARAHLEAVWYRLAEQSDDPSLPSDPLAWASTYVAFHLQEPIRLEFLARYVAKTSAGHLARLFRNRYGKGFTEYVRGLRMQKAAEMLVRSQEPVGRIAAQVGYQDGSRFARHFARHYRLNPLAYRKRFGGADAGAEREKG
jgi:AraC-like DNA-binding protein